MPADDDDATEFNSSQLHNSQEESTVTLQASSPDISTPSKKKAHSTPTKGTPRRNKRISTPPDFTPRRSKRVSTPTKVSATSTHASPRISKRKTPPPSTSSKQKRRKRIRQEEEDDNEDASKKDDDASKKDDVSKKGNEVISIEDDALEDIKEEKEYVKLTKRRTKKGQASAIWTYDDFRVGELIDCWEEKKIGKYVSIFLCYHDNLYLTK